METLTWEQQVEIAERRNTAKRLLAKTDFVVIKAAEKGQTMCAEWLAWRDAVREIARTGEGEIPPEPPRTRRVPDPEPVPVDIPVFLQDTPPHEVAEALEEAGIALDSPEKIEAEMTQLYVRYMSYAQYASKNTIYDGQGEVYWTRKAERYLRVRDWNRGRMAEKI